MKWIKFFLIGILFGIVMSKSEAISWYRIQEMFLFQSFHMYGIIMTALVFSALFVFCIKRFHIHSFSGHKIQFLDKAKGFRRYYLGGFIFGLGWSLVGACPGPLFTLVGHGYWSYLYIILWAMIGTFLYGVLRHRLPH